MKDCYCWGGWARRKGVLLIRWLKLELPFPADSESIVIAGRTLSVRAKAYGSRAHSESLLLAESILVSSGRGGRSRKRWMRAYGKRREGHGLGEHEERKWREVNCINDGLEERRQKVGQD